MANSSLVLFLLALFALSASADVFMSIDCGASSSYTDENFISWIGDGDLIQNGESEVVQSGNGVSDHVMSTLRVFSTRKKNCYTISANKGGQVLVRASFNYGNYDKKSSPPSFDLHFDGNLWATVETSNEDIVYYEAIYVVKGDSISVCVAQTKPNQLPFISALEVRSLGSHMYSHVDAAYALFLISRTAYGANGTIRFSADAYDRIWVPAVIGSGLNKVKSDALFIDVSVEDNPPQAVMQNAITTSTTSQYIVLGTNFPTHQEVPIYINMFFSEITELDATQKRSFQVYINNKPDSDTIVPPYGKVTEMYISNMIASSNTSFSLVATADSTLPPLINAMEVFSVSDQLTDGTNSKDVEGLAAIQDHFNTLQDWGGDPCLPSPYSWDWINCSSDATPRVTALNVSSFDLSGPLPDFSSMDALEIIDLHNNSISGPIPDFLGNLPSLKQLNLANNKLSGPVPSSLSKNNKLKLVVSGNPDLCVSGKSCTQETAGTSSDSTPVAGSSNKKKSSKLPVILGTSIPSFLVFWAILGFLAVLHHRRKTTAVAAHIPGQTGTPQGGATNTNMMNKIGQAVMHEIKVNIEDQVASEISDQIYQTVQNDQQDGRNA